MQTDGFNKSIHQQFRALQARRDPTCWVHSGRVRDVLFFDRSGSDRTRANLASRNTKSIQIFVCIDMCGHNCRWWYLCLRPIIKVYLLVACVCVCIAETARVRELKVILMLVLGRHDCVRRKCNINKLCFLSRCRKDEVADPDLPSPH